MQVAILNSISDLMVMADIQPDHVERLARFDKIHKRPVVNAKGDVTGSRLEMSYVAFVEYLSEIAI